MTDPTPPTAPEPPTTPPAPPAPPYGAANAAPAVDFGADVPPAPPTAPAYGSAPPVAPPAYGTPGYSGAQQQYAPARPWNVLSIVSLVTSILGLSIVGVITGHISLNQIKKTGDQGNVLAIIGLVLGYLGCLGWIFVWAAVLIPLFIVGASGGFN